jgi:hypothetical protein
MIDLLISVVLVGVAVTYIVEFIDLVTSGFFGVSILNKFLSLPLSVGGLFVLENNDLKLIVTAPATAFIALFISKLINQPVATKVPRLRGL